MEGNQRGSSLLPASQRNLVNLCGDLPSPEGYWDHLLPRVFPSSIGKNQAWAANKHSSLSHPRCIPWGTTGKKEIQPSDTLSMLWRMEEPGPKDARA